MTKRKQGNSDSTELRNRAVQLLNAKHPVAPKNAPSSEGKFRHELEVHQIELELQNEELRHARAALENGLDRYTQLFDFAPIGYATLTADGTVREMNHAGAGVLYERRSRLVGRRFADFISSAERASFAELLKFVLTTDRKETRDFDLLRVGDERPTARITAVSLAGADPTILIAFEDITAQKRAAERLLRADAALRDADRRKDEFLAVLSHELRTPLSTLLMYGQLLRQGEMSQQQVQAAAEAIERAARVQARLIEDLLDVSRIVAGKLSMNAETVDLATVLRAALDSVTKEAERKKIELVAEFGSDIPSVLGDGARIQQAVTNLLTNAVKFTPPGGYVRVHVRPMDQRVRIQVEDTGAGIDPEFLPKIFERFSQADRTITRSTGGLGLGLSIAQSIVEAHYGTLRAASPGRGKGSTFTITLPTDVAPRVAVLSSSPPPPATLGDSSIKGSRLLIVEDDESTRETLTDVLTFAGADVRGAEGGDSAMHIFNDFRPQVLVCDIAMPEEDGCALLRRIRARGPEHGGDIPALALTAFASDEDRRRTRAAGFRIHLVKPVDVEQLLSAVSKLLAVSGAAQAPSPAN